LVKAIQLIQKLHQSLLDLSISTCAFTKLSATNGINLIHENAVPQQDKCNKTSAKLHLHKPEKHSPRGLSRRKSSTSRQHCMKEKTRIKKKIPGDHMHTQTLP
jgi:hypothetical protein